jgi:hypothetical protein
MASDAGKERRQTGGFTDDSRAAAFPPAKTICVIREIRSFLSERQTVKFA